MTLTGRFFAQFGFIQVVGVLAIWQSPFLVAYLLLFLGLALSVVLDYKTLGQAKDFRLHVVPPKTPRLGQRVSFMLQLESEGGNEGWGDGASRGKGQPASVRALAPATELFAFAENSWTLRANGPARSAEAQVLKLGYERVSRWPIAIFSRRRYFQHAFFLPIDPVEWRVSPEHAVRPEQKFVEMLRSQPLFRQGARMQVRSRAQDQVFSIRRYQYPDPLRHIDQKKSARFGEPMTRTFDTLRSHHLVIALDVGRAMAGELRGSAKMDYYLSAALALAENALQSRDEVSLFAFAQGSQYVIRRARHLHAFLPLFRAADVFRPRDEESDYAAVAREVERLTGSRAIVVVLTDTSKPSVQEGLLRALAPICRRHLAVVTGLNDREIDLEENVLAFTPGKNFEPRYASLLYSYWMREKHRLFQEKLARLGGGSFVVNDIDWMATVERLYGLLRASRLA